MKERLLRLIRNASVADVFVTLFGMSFFIGVWYALPMVNTITDVWAFGGGVLRAIENHSLLPGYGVAYGTLSFYQNFIAMAVVLVVAFPFFGFDLAALKTALILNPSYTLLVPRVVSAVTAVVLLGVVYHFLKREVTSGVWRVTLLVLAFGNVLAVLLVRSGKMWILSTTLGIVSFIYMYRALTEEVPTGKPGFFSALSIGSAFLATANFAFAGLFLVNVPLLTYVFPKTREVLKRLGVMVVSGAALFIAISALNAANIIEQVSTFASSLFGLTKSIEGGTVMLSFTESLMVNLRQAIEAFPLLLVALAAAVLYGIRNKTLALLAALYAVLYMLALSAIFRVDDGIALNIRHVFPIGFFLMCILASCRPPARLVSYVLLTSGLMVYLYSVALLSLPTTYNAMLDHVVNRYSDAHIRIDESVFELTLPMNKKSYLLHGTSSCGSACSHALALPGDIPFSPVVVTHDADPHRVAALSPPDLFISSSEVRGCIPLVRFGNPIADDAVFDVDINLGRMLMFEFYKLRMLGKNLYLYDAHVCTPPPYAVRQ